MWRVYAHVGHLPGVVCCHPDLALLRDEFIRGVLSHEFGHLIAFLDNDRSEKGANMASERVLHLPIEMFGPLSIQRIPADLWPR